MVEIDTHNPVEELIDELATDSSGQYISCRFCRTAITSNSAAIEIGINHQHRFTNPVGITYTIRCFQSAPGCTLSGDLTEEHSWFGGYQWQFASCSHCGEHLGWFYLGHKQRSFFGLIRDRLCEDDGESFKQ